MIKLSWVVLLRLRSLSRGDLDLGALVALHKNELYGCGRRSQELLVRRTNA
jgi:hypothetical protein